MMDVQESGSRGRTGGVTVWHMLGDLMAQEHAHIDGRFDRVDRDIAVLKSDVAELKVDVAELKSDVSELKVDVAELKSDVSVLKVDVAELKSDVSVLKVDVAELKSDVSVLKVDMAETKEELGSLKAQVSSLERATMRGFDRLHAELEVLTGWIRRDETGGHGPT